MRPQRLVPSALALAATAAGVIPIAARSPTSAATQRPRPRLPPIAQQRPPDHLDFFTFYDFAPTLQAGWSYGLSPSLSDIVAAHRATGLQSFFGDLVHSCLVSPTPGCNDTAAAHYKVHQAGIINRGNTLDPQWRVRPAPPTTTTPPSPARLSQFLHRPWPLRTAPPPPLIRVDACARCVGQANIALLAKRLTPFIRNGTILGVFIGDELTCCSNKMSFANLTAVIDTLRAELGPGVGVIYTNDGPGTEANDTTWPSVPAGLDLLSFDLYDSRKGRHYEVTEVKAAFELVRPKLRPHQRMMLVPGIFGSHHAPPVCNATLAETSKELVTKLDAYMAWAREEPLIAGFCPWHLLNRSADQNWKPGCDQEVGAVAMPGVMAKLREMGEAILHPKTARLKLDDSAHDSRSTAPPSVTPRRWRRFRPRQSQPTT